MVKSYKKRKKGALHLPIYLERGFKNNQIEMLQNTTSSFEWLSVYKTKNIDKKPTETNETETTVFY